jgi:ADP-ribose pyrophosphatase
VKGTERISENDGWEMLTSETCFANDHVRVSIEEIRSPARPEPRSWTVVHRKRAVVIAPMTAEGELVLIRQERIPIRAAIWEFPAGQIDEETEEENEITAVALRELQEETGYELAEGGELIPLGDYFTSPGFTDEQGYFFLARPVKLGGKGHAHHESESILDCQAFSVRELTRMIDDNEIRDANTLGFFARLVTRGILSVERG